MRSRCILSISCVRPSAPACTHALQFPITTWTSRMRSRGGVTAPLMQSPEAVVCMTDCKSAVEQRPSYAHTPVGDLVLVVRRLHGGVLVLVVDDHHLREGALLLQPAMR